MKNFIAPVLAAALPLSAAALEISDMTATVSSKTGQALVRVKNDEGRATLLSIGVVQVDSPYEDGKEIPVGPAASNDIRFSPARSLIPVAQTVPVRFFYQGPKDDQERYYKVTWVSAGVGIKPKAYSADKQLDVQFSSSIKTILVVPPAQQDFSYTYSGGSVRNTGNMSFQAIAYGPCKEGVQEDICRERYWIGPGRRVTFQTIDNGKGEERLMLLRDGKYFPAEKQG